MNNVLSLVYAARNRNDSAPAGSAPPLRYELLILHQQMIAQLRLERLSGVGTAEFLRGMIQQHEQAAAMLRAQLGQREALAPQPFGSAP
jgi:hypothetical protein